jgi:hypothetical protein
MAYGLLLVITTLAWLRFSVMPDRRSYMWLYYWRTKMLIYILLVIGILLSIYGLITFKED